MDQDVAEPREAGELSHELRRELLVGRQALYGPGVVLEALPAAGAQFPGYVDDELRRGQQGEQDVVVKTQIPLQGFGPFDLRCEHFQVIEVFPQLGEPFHQVGHEESARSLICRIRRRNGSRSAARSCTSRQKA